VRWIGKDAEQLGTALTSLGERRGNRALKAAVTAYREALKERTPNACRCNGDDAEQPWDCADEFGERESGTEATGAASGAIVKR